MYREGNHLTVPLGALRLGGFAGFWCGRGVLLGWGGWQAFGEGLGWGAAFHAAALVRPAVIVAVEVDIENRLHLLDGLEPGAPAFDAEVLVEQRAMEALDDAVGLRPADLCGACGRCPRAAGTARRDDGPGGRRTRGHCR